MRRVTTVHADKPDVVGQIMTRHVRVASANRPVLDLAAPPKGPSPDVHAKLRVLIDQATDADNLSAMPSAFMAWL